MAQGPPDNTEDLDLTGEERARIDAMAAQLAQLGLYDLLGVPRMADRKAIKRAYNERVMVFHPDRFFRRRLGAYKPKLEMIIVRLTEAHDVLCSPEHRARYDVAVGSQRSSLVDAMLDEAVAEIREAAHSGPEMFVVPDSVRVPEAAPPSSRPSPKAVPTAAEVAARRQALAARLGGGRHTPAMEMKPVPVPGPAPPPRPSLPSSSIHDTVTKLRELHAKQKRRPLEGSERAHYELLRDNFARMFVAGQRVTLLQGQTPRQALRVACSLKVALTIGGVLHRTTTLDLSTGGLAALIGVSPVANTPCDVTLEVAPEPIRGRARIVGATRHGTAGQTFRVSIAFDPLAERDDARVEALVLDHALGNLAF